MRWTMTRYVALQTAVWLTVFTAVRLLGWSYNEVAWEYSLAFGAVIPAAMIQFWKDPKTLLCLIVYGIVWSWGRLIELGSNPNSMDEWIRACGVLAIVCAASERYRLMVVSFLMIVYSVRLSAIEASFWQQGLLNMIVLSFVLVPFIERSDDYASGTQTKIIQDHKEAA